MLLTIYSPIAQLVERLTVNQNVTGSSPVWGAKYRSVVQSGRTLALGARGRKFDSCCSDQSILKNKGNNEGNSIWNTKMFMV